MGQRQHGPVPAHRLRTPPQAPVSKSWRPAPPPPHSQSTCLGMRWRCTPYSSLTSIHLKVSQGHFIFDHTWWKIWGWWHCHSEECCEGQMFWNFQLSLFIPLIWAIYFQVPNCQKKSEERELYMELCNMLIKAVKRQWKQDQEVKMRGVFYKSKQAKNLSCPTTCKQLFPNIKFYSCV